MTAPGVPTGIDRRLFLAGLGALALPRRARALQAPAIRVACATNGIAGLNDWARTTTAQIERWWPAILARLPSPGFVPPAAMRLDFVTIGRPGIPAATSGTTIYIDAPSLLRRIGDPDAHGMIAHELVHVAQAYPPSAAPGWVTEGIADWLRYYVLLPADPNRRFDPAREDWRRGYQPASALIDWIETKHPGTVRAANAAMRRGKDGAAVFTAAAGGDLDVAWSDFLVTRPPAAVYL